MVERQSVTDREIIVALTMAADIIDEEAREYRKSEPKQYNTRVSADVARTYDDAAERLRDLIHLLERRNRP